MKFTLVSLAAICLVAVALPAFAHHSHGNYDVSKWTSIEGTVKESDDAKPAEKSKASPKPAEKAK